MAAAARLEAMLGDDRVRVDGAARAAFSIDAAPLYEGSADMVVFPHSTREVAAVLGLASELQLPVIARGAGTNLTAAAVPRDGGIVVSLSHMNRVCGLDTEQRLLVTQPGLPVSSVQALATEHALWYPPDPAWGSLATIGGSVATCAGGLRSHKYGVTRDYVTGLEAVLADGRIIRCQRGPSDRGYDLVSLLCGSEGTLALITEITLQLVSQPEATGVGVAYFPTLGSAGDAITAILRSRVVPSILEFLDRPSLATAQTFPRRRTAANADALLVFGQDDRRQAVTRDLEQMTACCRAAGAGELLVSTEPGEVADVLEVRRGTLPALTALAPLTMVEDITVPPAEIPTVVAHIQRIATEHEVMIASYGHAADGNLHPTCVLDPDDGDATERMHAAFAAIFDVALACGGTVTGEHGIGLAKAALLRRQLEPGHLELLRSLKRAFDAHGILNPGKLGS